MGFWGNGYHLGQTLVSTYPGLPHIHCRCALKSQVKAVFSPSHWSKSVPPVQAENMFLWSDWRSRTLLDPGLGTVMSFHNVPFLRLVWDLFFHFHFPFFFPSHTSSSSLSHSSTPTSPYLTRKLLLPRYTHSQHDTFLVVEPIWPFFPMSRVVPIWLYLNISPVWAVHFQCLVNDVRPTSAPLFHR